LKVTQGQSFLDGSIANWSKGSKSDTHRPDGQNAQKMNTQRRSMQTYKEQCDATNRLMVRIYECFYKIFNDES